MTPNDNVNRDLRSLTNRVNALNSVLSECKSHYNFLLEKKEKIESDITSLSYQVELRNKENEIIKSWIDRSMAVSLESTSDIVTAGLSSVINDQDLKFRIDSDVKAGKVVMKCMLEQTHGESKIEGDPVMSYGGGAATIISTILRLMIMQKMSMVPLLLLDESLVAVANQYVPGLASFLKSVSKSMGVDILMVTHNHEFMAAADTAYTAVKVGSSMKLKRTQ